MESPDPKHQTPNNRHQTQMESPGTDIEKLHDVEEKNDTSKEPGERLKGLLKKLQEIEKNDTSKKPAERHRDLLKALFGDFEINDNPCAVIVLSMILFMCGALVLSAFNSLGTLIAGAYLGVSGINVDYCLAIARTTILYSTLGFSILGGSLMIWVVVKIAHIDEIYAREYSTQISWIISVLPAHAITGVSISALLFSFCLHIAITSVASKMISSGLLSESWLMKSILNRGLPLLEAMAIYTFAVVEIGGVKDAHDIGIPVSLIFSFFSMHWAVPFIPYIFPNAFQMI